MVRYFLRVVNMRVCTYSFFVWIDKCEKPPLHPAKELVASREKVHHAYALTGNVPLIKIVIKKILHMITKAG